MSDNVVPVVELTIREHGNADALEIAEIRGYQTIVGKGQYETGQLAVYIPEQTIVKQAILEELNLWDHESGKGKLARTNGQVVKPIKLRGVLSEGLIWVPEDIAELSVGDDVAERYGFERWHPVIPASMAGKVEGNADFIPWIQINNFKGFDNAEMWYDFRVSVTAKIHGSAFCMTRTVEGETLISSKGQGRKGLVIAESESNVYWNAYHQYDLATAGETLRESYYTQGSDAVAIFGEVYGTSINGFNYDMMPGQLGFKIFDACYKSNSEVHWLTHEQLRSVFAPDLLVPELYSGKFDHDPIWQLACAKQPVFKGQDHVNEGVVVRSTNYPHKVTFTDSNGYDHTKYFERQICKMINPAYLERKGNDTEYE